VPPERERNLRPFLDLSAGLADFRESLLRLLRSGDARVDGRLPVDGREAIRIVSRLKTTLLVDAGSFEPIEWRQVFDGGIVVTTRFEAYERIAATKANKALLSVRAQHPDAKIDHGISIDPDPPGKRPTRAEAGERE
jgi:hypothetical protein